MGLPRSERSRMKLPVVEKKLCISYTTEGYSL